MKKGFTLIELLVVIFIIAILIGLSVFGLQGARISSRDARRQADLQQIRSALEIYKSDCGTYPHKGTAAGSFQLPDSTTLVGDPAKPGCAGNTYLAKVPVDPVSSRFYSYVENSFDWSTYRLCAWMEGPSTPGDSIVGCACGGTGNNCNYVVRNP